MDDDQFQKLLKSAQKHNLTLVESSTIATELIKLVQQTVVLSEDQKKLYSLYLESVKNYPTFFNEHIDSKKKFNLAKDFLVEKGVDKTRMRLALKVYGLDLKKLTFQKHKNLKSHFMYLNRETKKLQKSKSIRWEISFSINEAEPFDLHWIDEPSRKKSIINCLFKMYRKQYSNQGAIVAQLRKMGCEELPSY